VLTAPYIPMLFMGEEWGADTPWQYFTDHVDQWLADAVAQGRREEFTRYGVAATDVPDPQDPATFIRSKLDWSQLCGEPHAGMLAWYRELIALRRTRQELNDPRLDRVHADYNEQERWLMVQRGRLRIAANLGPVPQRLPLAGRGAAVLAASSPGITLDGDIVAMPAAAFAVIEV
jgi:maltooligosyltrehalose trehalohydrolase